jgi:hypothetical protein
MEQLRILVPNYSGQEPLQKVTILENVVLYLDFIQKQNPRALERAFSPAMSSSSHGYKHPMSIDSLLS